MFQMNVQHVSCLRASRPSTHLTQLTFGRCHGSHHPGALVLRCVLRQELGEAGGHFVLGLHGDDLLPGVLTVER